MAKTLKMQLAELRAENAALIAKLRTQIAQANRYFERMKMLEVQNNMLLAALRDAGIEVTPSLSKMGALRTRVLELGAEFGLSNVRIKGGIIELRREGNIWEAV